MHVRSIYTLRWLGEVEPTAANKLPPWRKAHKQNPEREERSSLARGHRPAWTAREGETQLHDAGDPRDICPQMSFSHPKRVASGGKGCF